MTRSNPTFLHRWLFPILSALLLLAVLFFLFPFASGYSAINDPLGLALWSAWTTVESGSQDYTYCLLVPLLVAYLVFTKWPKLVRTPVRGSTAAIGWVLLGLLLFWVGSRTGKQYLGEAGIQVLLLGVILWFWGREIFRPLAFAWVFLAFIWPLPFMDSLVAFPLRMIVSRLTSDVLNIIGIPCIRHGTALLSAPNLSTGLALGARFQIDVTDPCSGIHSLFPLLMFSAIYSYLFVPRRWQQWTVFLSAIPLIVLGNVVRILLLVLGCLFLGTSVALGTNQTPSTYHEGCGVAVFIVVLGLEWLLAYFLTSFEERRNKGSMARASTSATSAVEESRLGTVPRWRVWTMVGLAVVMLGVLEMSPARYLAPEAGVVMSLPSKVVMPGLKTMDADSNGTLYGTLAPVSEAEHTILPKDTEFARKNYEDFHGHTIFFSIVLSGLQQYTIHPPEICLVAQGWTIGKEEDVPIHLDSGHDLIAHCLHIQSTSNGAGGKPPVQALYYYWYVTDTLDTPSHVTRNLWSSWERIRYNRDHRWAYVTVMSPITNSILPGGFNEEQTRQMLSEFIAKTTPQVQKSEMSGSTE